MSGDRDARRARHEGDREEYERVLWELTGTTTPKAVGAGWSEGPRRPRRVRTAGPVTVVKPDGTVHVEPPLSPAELRKITGQRAPRKRR